LLYSLACTLPGSPCSMKVANKEAVPNVHNSVELITIGIDAHAQRIDNFLITHWKGVPKSRIYRLIRKGEIRVNKKRVKPETRLLTGDLLRLPPVRMADPVAMERPGDSVLAAIRDSILFENEDLLIINKPQGIAVHGGTGQRTGVIEALRWLRTEEGTEAFLELAHRIDKETSGCLVICKNARVLKLVQEAFKARRVTKIYLALVHGRWPRDLNKINAPLLKTVINSDEKVVKISEEGKQSETHFKVINEFDKATLLEVHPLTGRMHQIRVHCQHAGHPIVGDPKYTVDGAGSPQRGHRLCLHAASVSFELPDNKGLVNVLAPINPAMAAIIKSF
jgi:23S rRNA pseudouridine955/2504/2580 synthase